MGVFDKARTYPYGDYPIDRLLALDPRNTPPAPIPPADAYAGAFRGGVAPVPHAPPGAFEATTDLVNTQLGRGNGFVSGPKPNSPPGAFEATSKLVDKQTGKGGKDLNKPFYELWREGSDEDKDAIADQVEKGFEMQGVSMKEQAEKLASTHPAAMELAEKFGYVPPKDKAGTPPYKTQEAAFADAKNEAKNKPKWDRKAWGGFLMEAGLRILASQRGDAAGAIGEGVLGTMDARRQRAMEEQDRKVAMEELERKRRLEEAANKRAERGVELDEDRIELDRSQEKRLAAATEAQIRQINANISAGNIEMIQDKDGKYHVVKTDKPGVLLDEEGNPIEGETAADLSAAQLATWERQVMRDRADLFKQVRKEVGEGYSMDPEVMAIQEVDDPKVRDKMIKQLVDKRLQQIYQGQDGGTETPVGTNGDAIDWGDFASQQ